MFAQNCHQPHFSRECSWALFHLSSMGWHPLFIFNQWYRANQPDNYVCSDLAREKNLSTNYDLVQVKIIMPLEMLLQMESQRICF